MKITKILLVLVVLVSACKKELPSVIEKPTGHIQLLFQQLFNNQSLIQNEFIYVNAAGNPLMFNQIMYFISDVTLYQKGDVAYVVNVYKDIHYVDMDISESLTWTVFDDIPIGNYDSLSFMFGLKKEKNQSGLFVNYPEVNMMWPDVLGGGYHYLMINGKWKDNSNTLKNLNFHLGIGQIYKGNIINTDSIETFVDNAFRVCLPSSAFTVNLQQQTNITIQMHVDSWFKTPNLFDLNIYGGDIMQNQNAMHAACLNGMDVFTMKNE